VGTPVLAVADGTVVVAEDLFFEGNAVFIDHGDGLISMSFHLSEIKVQAGQEVKKGHTRGRIGSTGRATGDRTCSSASAGTTPASTPSSCLRTRTRSRPLRTTGSVTDL
jgi:murein DD-endopeptidase MepM/ murein hydrolase activator NlpD